MKKHTRHVRDKVLWEFKAEVGEKKYEALNI